MSDSLIQMMRNYIFDHGLSVCVLDWFSFHGTAFQRSGSGDPSGSGEAGDIVQPAASSAGPPAQ